ncbi:pseudouridine synthase deg1 [Rhodotorula kratochvilovae]
MPAPHNPDRAKLVQQIANLQHRLAQLDAASPPASTAPSAESSRASTPSGTSLTGKRARKAAQQNDRGPLPPSLANAPKRHIALLFSYEGWAHSGLAYQPKGVYTPLPTVEGCLLDALEKARLIEPIEETDGFGCGFERCGRTDAGVSSSAQVINLWVRSDLDDPMNLRGRELDPDSVEGRRHARARSRSGSRSRSRSNSASASSSASSDLSFDLSPRKPPADIEIPYITLLNRHLPPSIRVHAWSPVSASFSSRFSCIWRHYKYFFSTSPSVPLLASQFDFGAAYAALGRGVSHPPHAEGWQERLRAVDWQGLELDVGRMRDAVARLVGEHDFRNFCKVDPPKQLAMHVRTVNSASIDRVEGEGDDMWVLNLRGGAFLYNQVRHIVAVLFLVGAGLEPPSIVDALLWTSDRTPETLAKHSRGNAEEDAQREVMDRKPGYQMADDLPLILWQCGFNSSEFSWRTDNAPRPGDLPASAVAALEKWTDHNGRDRPVVQEGETWRKMFLEMNERYTAYRLKTLVLKHHLASFAFHAPAPSPSPAPSRPPSPSPAGGKKPAPGKEQRFTPLGAGLHARTTSYTPLLSRPRGELPETLNARWAAGRGAQRMQRRKDNQEEADRVREVNLKIKADAIERARRAEEERRKAEEVVARVEKLSVDQGGAETPVKGES